MRRRSLVGCALACALVFCVAASAAAPTNFTGTWVLDKTKSKDLPPQWADNLDSYTLIVAQDEEQLKVETKPDWKGGQPPVRGGGGGGQGGSGGGQGGGGGRGMGVGRGGGMGILSSLTYSLDGSEFTMALVGDRPDSITLKAGWADGGKALELSSLRKFTTNNGEERSLKTTERWELSADGKTLTVNRASESPRGNTKSTLVFNKQ
jgi:hypothetical protein